MLYRVVQDLTSEAGKKAIREACEAERCEPSGPVFERTGGLVPNANLVDSEVVYPLGSMDRAEESKIKTDASDSSHS